MQNIQKIHAEGNIYHLIKEKTLIDTSAPSEKQHILKEISKITSSEEIEIVLLTHMHYDHSGNLDLFPNAKIYASEKEIENFQKNPEDFLFGVQLTEESIVRLKNATPLPKTLNGLKIIELPGHTSGSVAFIDEENKIIFTGDTYFRKGVVGRTDLPTSAPEKMRNSLEKIQDYIDKGYEVMPGHDY